MQLQIRPERQADFAAVYKLVQESFASQAASEGDEQDFVVAMRRHPGYVNDLALIAEEDGRLAGYVMLTETEILGAEPQPRVLLLAPLCVHPDYWGRGVGGALIDAAFQRAVRLGFSAVFLAGPPDYYTRFGFRPAVTFGIGHQLAVPDKYILARELIPGALENVGGTVVLTGHTTCGPAMAGPPAPRR